jgi:CRP-like cAMP-binding protein
MPRYHATLRQSDIFFDCTPDQLEALSGLCSELIYQDGDLIFDENSSSDELYLIARGEIEILVNPTLVSERMDPGREPVSIAKLRRGQSFGEIALVDRGLRSAAARAAQDQTLLLRIQRESLLQLCETDPNIGYLLMRNLAADLALKIRTTDLRMRKELLYGSGSPLGHPYQP